MSKRGTALALVAVILTLGGTTGCTDWAPPELGGEGADDGATGRGEFRGTVIARSGLNIRESPTARSDMVGGLPSGASLRITCKVNGQTIDGNPRWYRLGSERWVAARYVTNVGAIPTFCP